MAPLSRVHKKFKINPVIFLRVLNFGCFFCFVLFLSIKVQHDVSVKLVLSVVQREEKKRYYVTLVGLTGSTSSPIRDSSDSGGTGLTSITSFGNS